MNGKYFYFISFVKVIGTGINFGNCEVVRPGPLLTIQDIDEITQLLKAEGPIDLKGVTILEYKLLRIG